MDIATTAAGAITLASQVQDTLSKADSYLGSKSLIDITSAARVEPLLLVDADVVNLEYIGDVAQTMQALFTGYYLQAIDIIASIGSVNVGKKLGPLNPNRPALLSYGIDMPTVSEGADWRSCMESYQHRLPTTKNKIAMALEAKPAIVSSASGKDSLKTVFENVPLSVGKMYEVTLKEGDRQASIKIAIRLMANTVPTSMMINLMSLNSKLDMDLKERFHAWKAGRLSFVKDLILCQDLIEKHRNMMIKDKSGVYSEIINRQNKTMLNQASDRSPSYAVASNLAIISEETAAQIEVKQLGKLNNYKTRHQVFQNTNLMILAVVDSGFERVKFYHRGIAAHTEMSIKDIKNSNKGNGAEITDVLKAFISGNAPVL